MTKNQVLNQLLTLSVNSHYAIKYINFIFSRSEDQLGYTENHHILPQAKSQFPQFKTERWNLISLTPREHFIAHWMLWKSQGKFMAYAFITMKRKSKYQQNRYFKINSKIYEKLKIQSALQQSIRIVSAETKSKMSLGQKRRAKIKCPHCDKIGNNGNMNRWHFNNCKNLTGILKHDMTKTNNTKSKINENGLSTHKQTGLNQIGDNNPNFKGYYIYNNLKFCTRESISTYCCRTVRAVESWCKSNSRLISKKSYNSSKFLQNIGDFDILKHQTYRDIGFNFEPKDF